MNYINRFIGCYEKNGEAFVEEIMINEIEFSNLLELIPKEKYGDDVLLYNCYLLDKNKLDQLSCLANKTIEYDLDKYEYYLEATKK